MKKILLLLTVATIAFSPFQANARHTARSTIIGAAGGALIGQAIGHDTEATLIGTAVGGVAGYMVGNEMDKNSAGYGRTSRVVEPYYPGHHSGYEKRTICRETEILAMVGGRPEQVVTMACLENGRWIIRDGMSRGRRDVVIENITYRPVVHKKKKRKKHCRPHRSHNDHPRWERVTVW